MVLVHATPGDLTAWTGQPAPDDAPALLRSASLLVSRATRGAVYSTLSTGAPRAAAVGDALRDAVCAQAAAWAALGIDPVTGGAGAAGDTVAASTIGSASVTLADPGAATAARAQAAVTLCADAAEILRGAGLLSGAVVSW